MKKLILLVLLLVACLPVTSTPEVTDSPTTAITVTDSPTVEPSPTREVLNQITTTSRASLRLAPEITYSTFIRLSEVGETFIVFEVCGEWLEVEGGFLYNGDWITGDISTAPRCNPTAQSRVGYNTLEVYDETYYLNHLRELCPAYMLVMDNIGLADRVYNALHEPCGTEVIHRDWHPSDGSEHLVRSPQEFVSRWQTQGYSHIIRYTTNEVSCYDNCEVYVAHEVEIARLARAAGFTVVLGNTGVGKFSPQSVLRGVFNPLVQAANDYDHLLGFHEYTGVCLCFGFGQMATEWLSDPSKVQPEQWSNNVSYDFTPFNTQTFASDLFGDQQMRDSWAEAFVALAATCGGNLPSYWHMGRSYWILLYYDCSTGQTSTVDVVHTEWGWDRLDDISSVVNPLQAQYSLEEFNYDFRGWQSYSRLWTELYWRDWSVAEAAYEQIKFTTSLYEDNHYFLLFAWTDNCNRDWYRAGFGFGNCNQDGDAQELHNLLTDNR